MISKLRSIDIIFDKIIVFLSLRLRFLDRRTHLLPVKLKKSRSWTVRQTYFPTPECLSRGPGIYLDSQETFGNLHLLSSLLFHSFFVREPVLEVPVDSTLVSLVLSTVGPCTPSWTVFTLLARVPSRS